MAGFISETFSPVKEDPIDESKENSPGGILSFKIDHHGKLMGRSYAFIPYSRTVDGATGEVAISNFFGSVEVGSNGEKIYRFKLPEVDGNILESEGILSKDGTILSGKTVATILLDSEEKKKISVSYKWRAVQTKGDN